MILIRNSQRTIKIDIAGIKKITQVVLDGLGYSAFDVGIWFTTNKTIRKYNREYRRKDRPTDVLSFPFHPNLKPGQRISATNTDDQNLGDIIISLEYVLKNASRWGHTFDQRIKVLLVHGICHLLGYDHIEDADYKVMRKKESELLKLLN